MANTAHPTKSSIFADGYLVRRAETHPTARRFLDVYRSLDEPDRVIIDAKLTQIQAYFDRMGILGAIELLMYAMEWRAVHDRPNKRRGIKLLRQGHALEQRGWPDRPAPIIVEED